MTEINIIRSKRKTISLTVNEKGLTVRAPLRMKDKDIQAFIDLKRTWIEKAEERFAERQRQTEDVGLLTKAEICDLAEKARLYIPKRVKYYADLMGVDYGNITIRLQKTRWGSCSAKKNLNFNCLLMLTPENVIDSVVVHELCHLKVMNHSNKFYSEILKIMPDYFEYDAYLKKNTPILMKKAGY